MKKADGFLVIQVLDGKPSPLQDTLSALDKVDESAFSKVSDYFYM